MTEPVTTNKQFTVPNTGDLPNAWGPPVNGNFTALDALLGSTASLTVASGSYTLTTSQAQNLRISLSGTLTANVTIVIPQFAGFFYFHDLTNRTAAGYTITVTTNASGQRTQNLPYRLAHVFTDGANVWLVSEPVHGETKPFTGFNVPPLWQAAFGQAVSRTTYSDLFSNSSFLTTGNISNGSASITGVVALPGGLAGTPPYAIPIEGTGIAVGVTMTGFSGSAGNYTITLSANASATTSGATIRLLPNGQGDGSTTFNLPDCRGRSVFGVDNGVGRLTNASMPTGLTVGVGGGSQALTSHNHGINDPTHTHTVSDPSHNHSINNPSHTHGITDPTHAHSAPTNAVTSAGYPSGSGIYATSPGFNGLNTSASPTGISVNAATTSITANATTTGITNVAAATGITTAGAGTGASQNVPPALMLNYIVYCGQ